MGYVTGGSCILLVLDVDRGSSFWAHEHRLHRRSLWTLAPHSVTMALELIELAILKLRERQLLRWLAQELTGYSDAWLSIRRKMLRLIERMICWSSPLVVTVLLRLYHLERVVRLGVHLKLGGVAHRILIACSLESDSRSRCGSHRRRFGVRVLRLHFAASSLTLS